MILGLEFHHMEYAPLLVYGLKSRETCGVFKILKAKSTYLTINHLVVSRKQALHSGFNLDHLGINWARSIVLLNALVANQASFSKLRLPKLKPG